jgi:succinate dehydrogenase/fumarate reductase iron-sulfur protein
VTRTVHVIIGEREYHLTAEDTTTVVDLLETIRRERNRSLAYRHSCHHGSCGTCGLMVNGHPRLACLTTVAQAAELSGDTQEEDAGPGTLRLRLDPLAGFPVITDLVVDTSGVAESFPEGAPHHEPLDPPSTGRDAYRLSLCIECGLCIAACPVTAKFQGPAALAAINRTRKAYPERATEMLERAALPDGVAACEQHFACSRVCPTGVAPGRQIMELRRALDQR